MCQNYTKTKVSRDISLFLLDANTPGFRKGKKLKKLGMKAQDTLLVRETAIASAGACFDLDKDINERKKGIWQGVIERPPSFSFLFLSFTQFCLSYFIYHNALSLSYFYIYIPLLFLHRSLVHIYFFNFHFALLFPSASLSL